MRKDPFVTLDAERDRELHAWLGDYIARPHAELGRDGPVCPFVEPSLRADSLIAVGHRWEGPPHLPRMVRMIEDATRMFRSIDWKVRNPQLHALVVLVTDLPEDGWWLIDEGHRATKDRAVAEGLMLGQFHPDCRAPAARNPLFPVNRAPWPMIAIRNMAFHDILFLHDHPGWFANYRARYSRYYDGGARIDPRFASLYASAVRAADEHAVPVLSGRADRSR
ncbi:DUF6875 domain-containing protein [Embleya sp. NPDC050493]|uniref:DUF6875 domain-containing protein n=1 Tax=Embleya sp. NPDC050493 TaxID=3363989 RepID=UPI0037A9900E